MRFQIHSSSPPFVKICPKSMFCIQTSVLSADGLLLLSTPHISSSPLHSTKNMCPSVSATRSYELSLSPEMRTSSSSGGFRSSRLASVLVRIVQTKEFSEKFSISSLSIKVVQKWALPANNASWKHSLAVLSTKNKITMSWKPAAVLVGKNHPILDKARTKQVRRATRALAQTHALAAIDARVN